jgi:hypothetical protein
MVLAILLSVMVGRSGGGMLNVPTIALAAVVSVAVCDAFVAPFLADEERQSLRVFGDVGGDAVVANACVGQGVGIAIVLLRGHGVYARLLEADERALGLILVTPVVYWMVRRCLQKTGELAYP